MSSSQSQTPNSIELVSLPACIPINQTSMSPQTPHADTNTTLTRTESLHTDIHHSVMPDCGNQPPARAVVSDVALPKAATHNHQPDTVATQAPQQAHSMMTRSKTNSMKSRVSTDVTIRYPLPRALLAAKHPIDKEPTCFTEAAK
ncbi:unnamed protein product [Ilex paraguariensis]|uniref:Uncharacterized protein n=1 Tax=Ilex paraguariensis TaxID=185542 RepID=A0ABC8R2D0_9AQUA